MELCISLIAALGGGGLFSLIFLPEIQRICFKKKLFDTHDERKVHNGVVTRLGGVAFFPAMVLSFLLVVSANILLKVLHVMEINTSSLLEWTLVLSAVIMLYFTGLIDDLVEVRYRSKLLIQVIAAALFTASGLWINDLHGFLGVYELNPVIGVPLTIIIIVSVINAFNFIDGIDGLAVCVAMLAFLFFGITLIHLKFYIISIFCFAALGMLIPFFYYNMFGKTSNHTKMFMGDCGSLTIGMLLAAIAVKVYHSAPAVEENPSAALVLGFSVLIVPMFDAFRVILFRLIKGGNPFKPDRNHLHHLLLMLGFSHKVATLLMITFAIFFGSISLFLEPYLNINLLVGVVVLSWGALNLALRLRLRKVLLIRSSKSKKDGLQVPPLIRCNLPERKFE